MRASEWKCVSARDRDSETIEHDRKVVLRYKINLLKGGVMNGVLACVYMCECFYAGVL